MSETSDSGQSNIEQIAAGLAFSADAGSASGPKTVINPERRGSSATAFSSKPPSGSSIWNRLFPLEPSPEGSTAEGPQGFELGHFLIDSQIGAGGMGAVFRALDRRLDRIVALKVLSPVQTGDPASVTRFQIEARAAAKLDHENVARVFYVGEDKGIHFIAYEYITGINIRDLIRQAGQLNPVDAVNYALQIASALKHTMAAGVVHRDIKPSNIIITPNGRAKIVDLGLARKEHSESFGEVTVAGTTLGTFDYIAPEQAKDPRNVDVRSDIYSLGCTLYHMLTGTPPYAEGTVLQKLLDHQGHSVPDPREKNSRVTPQLSAIVQKMMASDPNDRYKRPEELIRELMVIASGMGLRGVNPEGLVWSTPQVQRPHFWARNLGWMATTAVLLIVVVLLQWLPPGIGQQVSQQSRGRAPAPNPNRVIGENEASSTSVPDSSPTDTDPTPAERDQQNKSIDVAPSTKQSPGSIPQTAGNGGPFPDVPEFGKYNEPIVAPIVGSSWPTVGPNGIDESSNASVSGEDGPITAIKPLQYPELARRGLHPNPPDGSPGFTREAVEPIMVVSKSAQTSDSYPTLAAACRAFRDGDVIELNYDGEPVGRPEKPFRIEKKRIVIRAGKDHDGRSYRPIIVFDAGENSEDDESCSIGLQRGSLELINLEVIVQARGHAGDDPWAMIQLQGAGNVRLKGTNVTFLNPDNRDTALFELKSSQLDKMSAMKTGNGTRNYPTTEIEVSESLLRGNCNLIITRHTQAASFEIEQSVVAVDGSLLNVVGELDALEEHAKLRLKLQHTTCVVGDSLLRMDSGDESRDLLPVTISARNNIIAASGASPLVVMTGNNSLSDFQQLLQWEGNKNFYDRFDIMWSIQMAQGTVTHRELDFQDWIDDWGTDHEVDTYNDGITWARSEWIKKTLSDLVPADLMLDYETENIAAGGATDGSDAGADLSHFDVFLSATPPRSD